jgi:sugar lactone lactonase YvrE
MSFGETNPHLTGKTPRRSRRSNPWGAAGGAIVALGAVALLAWLARQGTRPANWGERFRYDISELKRVDPKLMVGRELSPLSLDIANPHAIAVDSSNRVYAGGDSAIAVLDSDGRPIRKIAIDRPVTCLAVGLDGSIYAGQTGVIAVLGPDGVKRFECAPPGTNAFITSVAVNEADLYAADAGQRMVWRFNLKGQLSTRIGARNKENGFPGFFVPSPNFDLALGPDGSLWVVDPGRHKFILFSPDGDVLSSWERSGADIEGFSGCCNPCHIAIRADGSFVTSEKGLVRVKIHAVTGSLVGVLAGPDRFGPDTRGIDLAVDGNGRILALDPERAVILVFTVEDK